MKVRYEVRDGLKMIEKDNYKDGVTDECSTVVVRTFLSDSSLDKLLKRLMKDYGPAPTLNACGEPGRVDFAAQENDNSEAPTDEEIERWKAGEIDLWSVTYSFIVEKVTREAVNIIDYDAPESLNK
jgi:hypothetical protein